jgi:tRNA-splicing ligase RtcB
MKIQVCGEVEDEVMKQMEEVARHEASYTALMADNHIGYCVPVGGVIAYSGKVCVNGVGYDIACGNKAVRLDSDAEGIRSKIYRTMNEIQKHISFGMGRKNNEKVDSALFDDPLFRDIPFLAGLRQKAMDQLGTVGSGNHYVDIFLDESDRVWVGVHFGSRGLGHSICKHFIEQGGGKDGVHAAPVIFDETSDLGEQYIRCMELAGRYAYAGRDWVCSRVAKILRGNIVEEIHNHHNFAWKERHFGGDYWVIRKGATPAFPGQKGFVGGTMGDISVILEGKEATESQELLYSTVHGAGRAMGRVQAKGKRDKRGNIIRAGLVNKAEHEARIKAAGVEVRGGDLDESPFAYKSIERVLEAHKNTINILHILKPIGVCMADGREFDPYRD